MDLKDLIKELELAREDIGEFIKNLTPEKKALIVVGVIVLIIIIYAFNPFASSPDVEVQTGTVNAPVSTPQPAPITTQNSTSTNVTNISVSNNTNGTFQISADQAKQTALNANPGYTADEPTLSTLTINNNAISVWLVPLKKDSIPSKEVYVNSETGIIVGTKIL